MNAAMRTIYRWRVRARYAGDDPAIRAELLRRAGRTADIAAGAAYGDALPEPTNYEWRFETKREGDAFGDRLEGVDGVTVESVSRGDRVLTENEGRSTAADLVAGRQLCVNCGAPINPASVNAASFPFGLSVGSRVLVDCPECGMKNDIEVLLPRG